MTTSDVGGEGGLFSDAAGNRGSARRPRLGGTTRYHLAAGFAAFAGTSRWRRRDDVTATTATTSAGPSRRPSSRPRPSDRITTTTSGRAAAASGDGGGQQQIRDRARNPFAGSTIDGRSALFWCRAGVSVARATVSRETRSSWSSSSSARPDGRRQVCTATITRASIRGVTDRKQQQYRYVS